MSSKSVSYVLLTIRFLFFSFIFDFIIVIISFLSYFSILLITNVRLHMGSSPLQQLLQHHASMVDDIGRTFDVQFLSLAGYAHKEVYAMVDQMVYPNHRLQDIEKTLCCAIDQSFGQQHAY